MSYIDYTIVIVYLTAMVGVGLYFQRKAASGINSYFLGNNKMPWWALGASGMASNLDVSGTMINVAIIYAFGAAGFFVEIRGGIVLIMAFLMIFMGKWNTRANVMTMAEWMELRFGKGSEGRIARLISALAILTTSVGIVTYFAVGAGKFIAEFLGIPAFLGMDGEFWAAILMITLAMIYTVASGLYGVVWTDVFQGLLIFLTILIICFISVTQFSLPESFDISIPLNDGTFAQMPTTNAEWTDIWPSWKLNFPENSSYSIYNLFGIAIIFYLLKTFVEGAGGVGGYMVQRFFAARSDRDAGLLSLFWTFLLSFRWPFIASIAIMGISWGAQQGNTITDPEKVLPIVINNLVPVGLKGLLVAGLMAAAMSTFDSIVNSAASYWVKDIYQTFINPKADSKTLMTHSRLSSIVIVALGLFFTIGISSINEIWSWLTMGLGAGLIIPLVIRWYWWRLNGYGFAVGTAVGMSAAILQKLIIPDIPEYAIFSIITGSSLLATILFTYLSPQTDLETIKKFYIKTRPFGLWGPVRKSLTEAELAEMDSENKRDVFSIFIAVPWQLTLFLTFMVAVIQRWDLFAILTTVLIILSTILYFSWFRHLSSKKRPT